MAEEKTNNKGMNSWKILSIIFLIVILVMGYMLVKDKFPTSQVIGDDDPAQVIAPIVDANLTVLIADSIMADIDDTPVLSNEELSLKF